MTWFKVDDGFYDHPKFLNLSNSAVGLWAKAGAWCSRHLTNGEIPASQVRALKGTRAQVAALISAQVWCESVNDSGVKVYRFHDWNEYQPSRELVLKERAFSTERQRKSRSRKRQEQQERENVTRDTPVTVTRDSRVTVQGVPQRPDPTRPDLYLKGGGIDHGEHAREDSPPQSLDELAAAHAGRALCEQHRGLDPDKVPPCRACKAAREQSDAQQRASRARRAETRRQAIKACSRCDETGLVYESGSNTARRCDHSAPKSRPSKPAPPF